MDIADMALKRYHYNVKISPTNKILSWKIKTKNNKRSF